MVKKDIFGTEFMFLKRQYDFLNLQDPYLDAHNQISDIDLLSKHC